MTIDIFYIKAAIAYIIAASILLLVLRIKLSYMAKREQELITAIIELKKRLPEYQESNINAEEK